LETLVTMVTHFNGNISHYGNTCWKQITMVKRILETCHYGNKYWKLVTMVTHLETSHYGYALWKLVTMVTHLGN
jgi:hypothetical protein